MADPYDGNATIISQCSDGCSEITPSDSTDMASIPAGICVNVSGLVKMTFFKSAAAVTLYLNAGVSYAYRVKRVYVTGTDAAVVTGKIFALF